MTEKYVAVCTPRGKKAYYALHSIVPSHEAMTQAQVELVWGTGNRLSMGRPVPHARIITACARLFEDRPGGGYSFDLLDTLPRRAKLTAPSAAEPQEIAVAETQESAVAARADTFPTALTIEEMRRYITTDQAQRAFVPPTLRPILTWGEASMPSVTTVTSSS